MITVHCTEVWYSQQFSLKKNFLTQENNACAKNSPGTDMLSLQFRLLYTLVVNHQLIRGNLPKIVEENGKESGAIKGLTSCGS